ncbi:MAG: hypothetical protein JW809_03990 [Pirellulales bacterium]|nr:hypothetical protein [Pirellulales bacterium]
MNRTTNDPTRRGAVQYLLAGIAAACLVTTSISARAALVEATWTGGAGTASYAAAANWDVAQAPVNDATNTYNVTIPASKSVEFDVDGIHDVTDLTLGTGSTLTIAPGERLNVLDDARISGTIATSGGTFSAPGAGAQFLGNSVRLSVSGGGLIAAGALGYTTTLTDVDYNVTLLSANGAGSLLDLSAMQSFSIAGSYGAYSSSWNYDVSATNGGVIDLGAVQSATGASTGDDDWLRFRIETGGNVVLTSLAQTTGRTYFQIDRDNFALPALEQTTNTFFSIAAGRTVNAPELLTVSGAGSGANLAAGATLNAGKLLGMSNATLTIAASGTFNAPNLVSFTNSAYTARPDQTFVHGVITDVNGSNLYVENGATWDLSGATGYVNTLSNYRAHLTLLSADGSGSLLDLSGLQSFSIAGSAASYSGPWNYDVSATNGGVVDLSGLQSVIGASTGDDESLRFRIETGGNIPLDSLVQVTGRTHFQISRDNYSLPALVQTTSTSFSLAAGTTLDAGELASMEGTTISIGDGGAFHAPKLVSFTGSTYTARPGRTFAHGAITDVNRSRLAVEGGATWDLGGVAAYANTMSEQRSSLVLLGADGAGSQLDLSGMQSLSVANSYGNNGVWYYDVSATNGGVVDLSSLQSVTGAATNNDDWLRFRIETGGDIPLTALAQTAGRTYFQIDRDGYSLPALEQTANTAFSIAPGRAASLPELHAMSGSGSAISLAAGATLDAGELTSLDSTAITIGTSGTFNAPNLVSLTGSTYTARPVQTFVHGVITDVDRSRLFVERGATWDVSGATGYANDTLVDYRGHLTLLSADGAGSLLDLSGMQSFSIANSYGHNAVFNYDVSATNGAVIDLSSVQSVTGAATNNDDWLRFRIETGGDIPLAALAQTTGRTYFQIDRDDYSLPALQQAGNTFFSIAAGRTVNLPQLHAMSGAGTGVSLAAGATLDAAELLSIDSATIAIGASGAFNAPKLISLTASTYTARPNQTFVHGAITDVNRSRLFVADGAAWDLSGVTGYANDTLVDYRAHLTLFSADGAGSLLDLSGMQSLSIAGAYGHNAVFNYDVSATNGGTIDLSGLQSATGASTGNDDWLRFRVESGGSIDLGGLRSLAGRTRFEVGGEGTLELGDLPISGTTYLSVNHPDAHVNVHGSLYLEQTGQLTLASGAGITIEGDFLFALTDEAKLATSAGSLHMAGAGVQYLEAGGQDLGSGGGTTGNFGLGRLLIGREDQPTTVMLLNILDNGNRAGGAAEALYLYGMGGLDGLEMAAGSRLVLDGLNVYTYQKNTSGVFEWVHLNSLFGPGVSEIPFAGGTVAVPEPAGVALVTVVVFACLVVRRRLNDKSALRRSIR